MFPKCFILLHLLVFKDMETYISSLRKNARMLSSSTHQFSICRTCPKEQFSVLYWWLSDHCICMFGSTRMRSVSCSCSSLLSAPTRLRSVNFELLE